MRKSFLCAALVVGIAWPAGAQMRYPRPMAAGPASNPRVFISVNAGMQPVPDAPADRFTFGDNLETATVDVEYALGRPAIFEGGVAMRLWRRVGAGVALSRAALDAAAAVDARIPHPFFFEQPRTVTGDVSQLKRSETAVHFQVVYLVPARPRIRVLLSAGPSRMSVEHDLVTDVHYQESYPFDSAAFRSTSRRSFTGSTIGIHAGVDVAYMLTRTIGAGGMIRFSHGDIDMAGPDSRRISIETGGIQAGGGLRVVF
jgi:hypothetical protein